MELEKNVEQFEITDDNKAEWALKKVLEAKKEKQRLLDLIAFERAELDRKEKQVEERYENETSFLLAKLNTYLDTVETKKTKTQEKYRLLSGNIVRKFAGYKLTPNKSALLEWCRVNAPESIKKTEDVAWIEVKGKFAVVDNAVICTETGEFVDCINIEEKPAVLDVVGE